MKEVVRKLKFQQHGIVLNAPSDLEKEFVNIGFETSMATLGLSIQTLIFVNDFPEFESFLRTKLHKIKPDSLLWFAYPKRSSGINTNINRDKMRLAAPAFGIKTVAAISINETWSALRFRPTDKVGK